MKKLRNIVSIMLVFVLTAAFAACAGKDKAKEYNVDEIADAIAKGVSFEDQYIAKIEQRDFALNLYGIEPSLVAEKEGVKEAAVYISGSSPEMVVCIKAVDAESASLVLESVERLISTYITNYTNYGPEQVEKLETAVKLIKGQYVFVTVSNDNTAAASFINDLLNK